ARFRAPCRRGISDPCGPRRAERFRADRAHPERCLEPIRVYFSMNVDPKARGALSPGSGTQYFSQQVFNATINITDRKSLKSRNVGMITDTGATTELHNTQESRGALPNKYDALINWDNQQMDAGELKSGLNFALSGRPIWGKHVSFFSF